MTDDSAFLDTSYAVALSARTDRHHSRALELARELTHKKVRIVTTRAVLLEIGNALAKAKYRAAAANLLRSLERDPQVEIVQLDETLYDKALTIFCKRTDKERGLIDCISYIVMNERGMSQALTADEHFEQMGFTVLLRE